MHLLPLPDGRGSVSRINYIRSRDRKGAVKGAGDANGFEGGNTQFDQPRNGVVNGAGDRSAFFPTPLTVAVLRRRLRLPRRLPVRRLGPRRSRPAPLRIA